MSTNQDPHHCHCFQIEEKQIPEFRKKLESLGFKDGLQEDHGQVFGLIKTNGDDKQMHIKVMPTGQIEAEIEPSHSYPFAHINSKHSYSAHPELEHLFRYNLGMTHQRKRLTPLTCIKRIIIDPDNPTHIGIIVVIGIFAVVGGVVAYYLTKEDKPKKT